MLNIDKNYPKKLEAIKIKILDTYIGANKHHKLQCMICDNIWSATPKAKIQNFKNSNIKGCPKCVRDNILKHSRRKALNDINKTFNILTKNYDGRRCDNGKQLKIEVQNKTCSHIFTVTPGNILSRNVICPICNTEKKREQFRQWTYEKQKKYLETASSWKQYKSKVSILTRKNYETYKLYINPHNLTRAKAGIKNAYHLDHIVPVRYCFDNNIPCDICAHPQNLELIEWKNNISHGNKLKDKIPPIFNTHINKNTIYKTFVDTLKQTFGEELITYYKGLSPYVLTVYLQKQKIGILFCPLDDYKEQTIKNKYLFRDMHNKALIEGITFIQIFEDEWFYNKDLWIKKLKHISNNNISTKIHARKCKIRLISAKEKNIFLTTHHIQGKDNSTIKLGAFYNNELISVMTFLNPRIITRGNHFDTTKYELCRFATNTDYRIPGIASKLLKYFTRNYNYTEIYSYADMRYSQGKLYYALGFELDHINNPDYYYIIDGKRKHRWGYRKDMLKNMFENYDKNISEYDNMLNNNYDRIWGCGTIKFTMKSRT